MSNLKNNPFSAVTLTNIFQNFNNPQVTIWDNGGSNPKQRWLWKIRVSGREIAGSTEGYESRAKALENLKNLEGHLKWLRENGKLM